MNGALAELAGLIRQRSGLALPAGRADALHSALCRVAPGTDAAGFLRAAADPARGRALLDRLLDELTVQETYFARDIAQLRQIPWAELAVQASHHDRPIRVWSAGCATGEEVYTLIIEAVRMLGPGQPVEVLGTDLSRRALDAAAAGRYAKRSVRELGPTARQRFLHLAPDHRFAVREEVRSLARFSRHNLALDPAPPPGEAAFDVVVCRNVLIYLDTALVGQATRNLEAALRPEGTLVLGATDILHQVAAQRASVEPDGASTGPVPPPSPAPARRPAADAPAGADARADAVALADADAHLVDGLAKLQAGNAHAAVVALRRALAADPTLGLAAFALGRACDRLGDSGAARAAYEQALRTLDPADQRHELMLQQIDIRDITAACRARLGERLEIPPDISGR